LQKFEEIVRLSPRLVAVLLLFAPLSACNQALDSAEIAAQEPGETQAAAATPVLSALPASNPVSPCRADGHFQTELFGALDGPLSWSGSELECSGMPRPNGAGARLRFAGQVIGTDRRIAMIIALPDLQRDELATELGSKVTLIDESSGRFFTTWDIENCWTDITAQESSDESGDRYNIDGTLYCVSPLAEMNGNASVSITELSFAGSLDWSAK
jgi:hypothetical protein